MNKKPITNYGKEKLTISLRNLHVKEKEFIQSLTEASKLGDFSENFEYHEAKRSLARIRHNIHSLDHYLKASYTPITSQNPTRVAFGLQVSMSAGTEIMDYIIVGEREASIEHGSLSITSPLASAIFGKTINEEVIFNSRKYKILSITKPTEEQLKNSIYVE